MASVTLGRTGITVEQNAFGALPIQRISKEAAVKLLHRAYEGGMRYFDTARAYSDSEEKLGAAFAGMWDKVFLATKTGAQDAKGFRADLETSLRTLKRDYIDVYQFHNPAFCPLPGGEDGLYDAAVEAQKQGKIRFISITNHRLDVARQAVESGLYATLQFPFSYLASDKEIALAQAARDAGMGFIAMKGLSGGLITNSAAAYAYIAQFPWILPIWGVQRDYELEEFLSYFAAPPAMTAALQAVIDADRKELVGEFCRGCGYCLPCPQGINIPQAARASLMLRRAPTGNTLGEEGIAMMKKIEDCVGCYQCASRCPYELDTPALLKRNYADVMQAVENPDLANHSLYGKK